MKKYKLRRWVKVVLIIGLFISLIIGACEVKDTKIFIIKSLLCLLGLVFNGFILLAFGEDYE